MGRPVFLVDNVFSLRQYPSHTLTASSTVSGTSVERLASGRRRRELSRWAASAANTDAWVEAAFDRLRGFDLLYIDRDHNLSGHEIRVDVSDDDFTTYTSVGAYTVPAAPTPYASLYDDSIIRTDEGAVLVWLGLQASSYVRLYIPAMGADLAPEMAGVYVGKSWSPAYAQTYPLDIAGQPELIYAPLVSPQAQAAAGEWGRRQSGEITLKLDDEAEYATARYHLDDLYSSLKPMVVIPDDEEAERAVLAVKPPGREGFRRTRDWFPPQVTIPWEETEPRLGT